MGKKEEILIQCIEDIRSGESSLAECLDRYPYIRQELSSLLEIALNIQKAPDVLPSNAYRHKTRANLMNHIYNSRYAKEPSRNAFVSGMKRLWDMVVLKPAVTVVVVILLLSTAGTGTVYASQDSLPNDALYRVKLGSEQLQRLWTLSDVAEIELELQFIDRRLEEIRGVASRYPDEIPAAIAGYERNMNLALSKIEEIEDSEALLERVALEILNQFYRLDDIEDGVSDRDKEAVFCAKEVALNGQCRALSCLLIQDPVRAAEINFETIQARLARAELVFERGNCKLADKEMQQCDRLCRFNEEICCMAQGMGCDMQTFDELHSRAVENHGKTLCSIYGNVTGDVIEAQEDTPETSAGKHDDATTCVKEEAGSGEDAGEPSAPKSPPDDIEKGEQPSESKGQDNNNR